MNIISWSSSQKKLSELIPAKYNPRQLTKSQEKDLTASIEKFDLADPIIINLDNIIIGGHQRIKVLKKRGVELVDVRIPNRQLTSDEEKELNVRLNKNLGEWDMDLLLDGFDVDMLRDIGFTDEELFGAEIIDDIELPSGEGSGFQQMTFILSDEQVTQVKNAIAKAKGMGAFVDTGNQNSNGNAIARVCETFNGNS